MKYTTKDDEVFAYDDSQEKLFQANIKKGHSEITEQDALLIAKNKTESVVPNVVTRAQGKAALILANKWNGVLDYVESVKDASEKSLSLVALNDTVDWHRDSPFLNSAASAIGLTDKDLDDLFIAASKIIL
jgi:hypothetical protein